MDEVFEQPTETSIVGEAVSGRAEEVRRKINKLIKATNVNTFDLAELLDEAKTKGFYTAWGYPTYSAYAKSLEIKYAKAYYLITIVQTMRAAGVKREDYEPIGIGKLRVIAELDPEAEFQGTPVVALINELTMKAGQMTAEEVRAEVDRIKGKSADEAMCWMNIHILKMARENVAKPAFALVKKHMAQTQDEEGNAVDASDGRALEMLCANILADPNFNNDLSYEERRQHLAGYIKMLQAQLDSMPQTAPSANEPTEDTNA